jgi:hypothetical protein
MRYLPANSNNQQAYDACHFSLILLYNSPKWVPDDDAVRYHSAPECWYT